MVVVGSSAPVTGLGNAEGVSGNLSVPAIDNTKSYGLPEIASMSSYYPGLLYASSIIYRPLTFPLPYWSPSQPSLLLLFHRM